MKNRLLSMLVLSTFLILICGAFSGEFESGHSTKDNSEILYMVEILQIGDFYPTFDIDQNTGEVPPIAAKVLSAEVLSPANKGHLTQKGKSQMTVLGAELYSRYPTFFDKIQASNITTKLKNGEENDDEEAILSSLSSHLKGLGNDWSEMKDVSPSERSELVLPPWQYVRTNWPYKLELWKKKLADSRNLPSKYILKPSDPNYAYCVQRNTLGEVEKQYLWLASTNCSRVAAQKYMINTGSDASHSDLSKQFAQQAKEQFQETEGYTEPTYDYNNLLTLASACTYDDENNDMTVKRKCDSHLRKISKSLLKYDAYGKQDKANRRVKNNLLFHQIADLFKGNAKKDANISNEGEAWESNEKEERFRLYVSTASVTNSILQLLEYAQREQLYSQLITKPSNLDSLDYLQLYSNRGSNILFILKKKSQSVNSNYANLYVEIIYNGLVINYCGNPNLTDGCTFNEFISAINRNVYGKDEFQEQCNFIKSSSSIFFFVLAFFGLVYIVFSQCYTIYEEEMKEIEIRDNLEKRRQQQKEQEEEHLNNTYKEEEEQILDRKDSNISNKDEFNLNEDNL